MALAGRLAVSVAVASLIPGSVLAEQVREGLQPHVEPHIRSVLEDSRFQTKLPEADDSNTKSGGLPGSGPGGDGTGSDGTGRGTKGQGKAGDGTAVGPDGGHAGSGSKPAAGGEKLPERSVRSREERARGTEAVAGGGWVIKAFIYMLFAVFASALAIAFVRSLARYRRLNQVADNDDLIWVEPRPRQAIAPTLLDELLQAGQWEEAVHLLLRQTLEKVPMKPGQQLEPSLTSREILRRGDLNQQERDALTALVTTVERSFFGGQAVTREEYERCAAASARLAGGGAGA